MVLDTYEDQSGSGYMKSWWTPKPTDEDVKAFIDGAAKVYDIFEKHLASHPDWQYIAGNKPSIGDFKVVASVWSIARNDNKRHPAINDALRAQIEQYPLFNAYVNRLGEEHKEYLANRPKCTA